MEPIEQDPIRITLDDVNEANLLSLTCPYCANPVERYTEDPAMVPVACTDCGTLYHKACRDQIGEKCAVIGCEETKVQRYGETQVRTVVLNASEIGAGRVETGTEALKRSQREQNRGLVGRFFVWLFRQLST